MAASVESLFLLCTRNGFANFSYSLGNGRRALAGNVTECATIVALGLRHLTAVLGHVTWLVAFVANGLLSRLSVSVVSLAVEPGLGTIARNVTRLATVVASSVVVALQSLVLGVGALAGQVTGLLALEAGLLGLLGSVVVGLVASVVRVAGDRLVLAVARQMARLLALVARLDTRR